ncbi:MAG: UDP-glucose 4-epimerase GalE [Burkholderiales bacterium]|nr:UDP-glucose 4-epimerase GalE [Burkholderiales bacterium]
MAAILVTGGAGYIGSHMVRALLDAGHRVVTLDDLSEGYRDAVQGGEFVEGDIADRELVTRLLKERGIAAVMNFASFIQVGESTANPSKYYGNNLVKALRLIDAMREAGVDKFIFSSTAAVYGEPVEVPIPESHPLAPVNPYGRTKLMVEAILADYGRAYGLKSVSLRYFNAAGADPSGALGERHEPESHLIPLVLRAAAGSGPALKLFGEDYDTPDGTCVRDYVHVTDLCGAHLLALESLLGGGGSAAYNLGNGTGFSVKEVIATAERVTGRRIPVDAAPRRPGDAARLVADATLARQRLGWRPRYQSLETIVAHAWAFERRRAALPARSGDRGS